VKRIHDSDSQLFVRWRTGQQRAHATQGSEQRQASGASGDEVAPTHRATRAALELIFLEVHGVEICLIIDNPNGHVNRDLSLSEQLPLLKAF
jgi:hypothetical protein